MSIKVKVVTIDMSTTCRYDVEFVDLEEFNEQCVVEHATDGDCETALEFYGNDNEAKNKYCLISDEVIVLGGEETATQYIKLP